MPLIDLSIVRRPALAVGLSSGLVSYLALFGILFAVPYYLSAEHISEAWIGLQLAVLPVAIGVTAPLAGRLVDRVGDSTLTAGGLLLAAAGCSRSPCATGRPDSSSGWHSRAWVSARSRPPITQA